MTNSDQFNQFSDEERAALNSLSVLASGIQPDEHFVKKTQAQLEQRFAANHAAPANRLGLVWRYLAGTVAVLALVFGTIWLVRTVAPEPGQGPAVGATTFACPVTHGNGSQPPGETLQSQAYLGNGQLWTDLWPDGKIVMTDTDRESDGAYSMKWAFWRGVSGEFSISGRRLDAPAGPLRAHITSGYGESGLIVFGLVFPSAGCWEVTGHVGDASLTFVTEVVFPETPVIFPTAQPETTSTPIPTPAPATFEKHGTTIHMTAAFPQAPVSVGLYTHAPETPVTEDIALALAQRFGIQAQIYLPGVDSPGAAGLLVSDGKQRLMVNSAQRYSYSADFNQPASGAPLSLEAAAPGIDAFLKAHGYDFEYQLSVANGMGTGWFYVIPLSLEARPVRFDFGIPQGLSVQVNSQGQVIALDANLLDLTPQAAGQFELISAEQAWQHYLDPSATLGFKETFRSGSTTSPQTWARAYGLDAPFTIYGHVASVPALKAGQPPLLTLDIFTLGGKTTGMENIGKDVLVQASGQFIETGGIRIFQVDEWQVLSQYGPSYLPDVMQGNLRQEADQVIFNANGADYVLPGVPADVPLPLTDVTVAGYLMEPKFEWQTITWFNGQSHGGGGGGGGGGNFAQLNLSGTPVPWPTPQSAENGNPGGPAIGQSLDGEQGLFMVNIYEKADGSRRTEYGLLVKDAYYLLQGEGLSALEAYHNRPVNIWGAVSAYNQNQTPVVTVQRFEVPYPDLKIQILRGTQKKTTLAGESVLVFTAEDGSRYVQLSPTGISTPGDTILGVEGDLVELEALVIPGESLDGLPGMRIFGGGLAVNPKNGQPSTYPITADQPQVITESDQASPPVPELTIEKIELVYFTSDPRYAAAYPEAMSPYLQPVWRFYGHYSTGDEVEILIQALTPEDLLPEAAPAVQGG